MKDLYNNIAVSQVLNPVTATSNQTSSAIDMQGYNSLTVLFALGATGDTLSGSILWTLKLQHSDTDSSYADVATTDLLGGVSSISIVVDSNSEDETVYKFGYVGGKRYVKALATKTGTHSNGTPIGILALKGHPTLAPVA